MRRLLPFLLLVSMLTSCAGPAAEITPSPAPLPTQPADPAVPAEVRIQTEARLQEYWAGNPLSINRLEYAGSYDEQGTLVEVYAVSWSRYESHGDAAEWIGWDDNCLVFFRRSGADYELLGEKPVYDGDLEKAAEEVMWGVSQLEFSFGRDGFDGWVGIGSPQIPFFPAGEAQVERMENWDVYNTGDYWETLTWDGFQVLRYVNYGTDGSTIASRLSTTLPDLFTYRGGRVGMTRAEIAALYPEASADPCWDWAGDYLWVGPEDGSPGYYLAFYFDGDAVSRIDLVNVDD